MCLLDLVQWLWLKVMIKSSVFGNKSRIGIRTQARLGVRVGLGLGLGSGIGLGLGSGLGLGLAMCLFDLVQRRLCLALSGLRSGDGGGPSDDSHPTLTL